MMSDQLVCVVDDGDDYRFLLQQLFKRFFSMYSVRFFASGVDFIEALSQMDQYPKLILLDQHMPDLNGHQTLLRLKQHPRYQAIPVVMMSAHASIEELSDCYQAGVNSFLYKPLDFNSLKDAIALLCQYWLELNQVQI